MSSFLGAFQSLQAHEARRQQTNENKARMATSYSFVDSSGSGELVFAQCLEFSCTFIEEPGIAHGFALDGDRLVDKSFPRVTAGVTRWRTNHRGHYTGCWVYFVVDVPGSVIDPDTGNGLGYDLSHTFTFTGIAIKDLPDHLLDL